MTTPEAADALDRIAAGDLDGLRLLLHPSSVELCDRQIHRWS